MPLTILQAVDPLAVVAVAAGGYPSAPAAPVLSLHVTLFRPVGSIHDQACSTVKKEHCTLPTHIPNFEVKMYSLYHTMVDVIHNTLSALDCTCTDSVYNTIGNGMTYMAWSLHSACSEPMRTKRAAITAAAEAIGPTVALLKALRQYHKVELARWMQKDIPWCSPPQLLKTQQTAGTAVTVLYTVAPSCCTAQCTGSACYVAHEADRVMAATAVGAHVPA